MGKKEIIKTVREETKIVMTVVKGGISYQVMVGEVPLVNYLEDNL